MLRKNGSRGDGGRRSMNSGARRSIVNQLSRVNKFSQCGTRVVIRLGNLFYKCQFSVEIGDLDIGNSDSDFNFTRNCRLGNLI